MRGKIKAVSPLSLKSNRFTIFELSLAYFPEFSPVTALFLEVIQTEILISIAPYSKDPKALDKSHSHMTNIQ